MADWLDLERLRRDTDFVYCLPTRGEQITLRRIHTLEPGYLVLKGSVDEYEGQHTFSARLLALASVRPILTEEDARRLGPDAVEAAAEVLRRSGLVAADPE